MNRREMLTAGLGVTAAVVTSPSVVTSHFYTVENGSDFTDDPQWDSQKKLRATVEVDGVEISHCISCRSGENGWARVWSINKRADKAGRLAVVMLQGHVRVTLNQSDRVA